MRCIISVVVFCFSTMLSVGQEFRIGANYDYLYANKWDQAVQTYNFSRPYLANKQPLINNGLSANISYVFKSSKTFRHGVQLLYAYFRSAAENEGLDNTLNLHFINPGYILHFENPVKTTGLYADLVLSVVLGKLFRNVNGEPFEFDDDKSKAPGIGGEINIQAGYNLKAMNKISLSPFVGLGYVPYYYSPNTEAVVNQTNGLAGRKHTGILNIQAGMLFHLTNFRKNEY